VRPANWWRKQWRILTAPPVSRQHLSVSLEALEDRTALSVTVPVLVAPPDYLTPALVAPAISLPAQLCATVGQPGVQFDAIDVGSPEVSGQSHSSPPSYAICGQPASVKSFQDQPRDLHLDVVRTDKSPELNDAQKEQNLRYGLDVSREAPEQRRVPQHSSPWRERLMMAVIEAYHENDLRIMLDFRMNENYDAIVSGDVAFRYQVYELITWARQHGRLVELATHFADDRPFRKDFAALRDEVAPAIVPFGVIPLDGM
jgi:hypothetical protein